MSDCLCRITTRVHIPVDFLDPFKVNDGYDADQQIDVLCHIGGIALRSSMQAFVKQQIRTGLNGSPRRKGSGRLLEWRRFVVIVQIQTRLAGATLSVRLE
jgi:hypothetical protein